ncbi:MAG: hypothetical protein JW806_01125 [Sedimentisphaerales bacterium]|nr:hypothetical protein [Sedimentisphaerales bacterium]
MLEALEYYQSLAQKFQSQLLTGPGILIVLIGICIWLSGLRWKMLLGALAGAAIGAAGVLACGHDSIGVIMIACAFGFLTGAVISEIVLGLFGAVVGAVIVMLLLAGGIGPGAGAKPLVEFYDANEDEDIDVDEITVDDFVMTSSYPTWPEYEEDGAVIPSPKAIEITREMMSYFASEAKDMIAKSPTGIYAGGGFAMIVIIVLAIASGRLFVSVTAAMFGTALIFAGMIILLFYKGSQPIGYIAQRPGFYWLVCIAMVTFGALVQLFLTPVKKKPVKAEPEKKKDNEQKEGD